MSIKLVEAIVIKNTNNQGVTCFELMSGKINAVPLLLRDSDIKIPTKENTLHVVDISLNNDGIIQDVSETGSFQTDLDPNVLVMSCMLTHLLGACMGAYYKTKAVGFDKAALNKVSLFQVVKLSEVEINDKLNNMQYDFLEPGHMTLQDDILVATKIMTGVSKMTSIVQEIEKVTGEAFSGQVLSVGEMFTNGTLDPAELFEPQPQKRTLH